MAQLDVGSLPICGEDNRLKGMITDRDIVVKAVAQGRDPASVSDGELAQGKPITIGADDDAAEILRTMGSHQVRRLPVIDGHDLVGMVAVAERNTQLRRDRFRHTGNETGIAVLPDLGDTGSSELPHAAGSGR